MDTPYWFPYWGAGSDERQLDVQIESEEDEMTISYRRLPMVGSPDTASQAVSVWRSGSPEKARMCSPR